MKMKHLKYMGFFLSIMEKVEDIKADDQITVQEVIDSIQMIVDEFELGNKKLTDV